MIRRVVLLPSLAALAVAALLGAGWRPEGPRTAATLSPAGELAVRRGGAVVWGGRLAIHGDNEPGFRFAADPLGAVRQELVLGPAWFCAKTLGTASAVVGMAGDDLSIDVTVRVKAACRFLRVDLGGTGSAPRTWASHHAQPHGWGWLQGTPEAERLKRFWPSGWTPFRLAAWRTATASVCVSLADAETRRCVFVDGPSLFAIVEVNLPAGGEAKLPFRVRFADAAAPLPDLLGRYSADFRAAFGELRYKPDARPIVQWIRLAAHHDIKPTPDNPYGWTNWRPDTLPHQAKSWTEGIAFAAKRNGFQGAIAWGFAWAPPQADYWGYPVDSCDLPPPARKLYDSAFAAPFGERGLSWGCLQRAATSQFRDAAGPVWITVDGSPASARRLAHRLTRAGTLHYCDTTPDVFGVENSGATPRETADAFREARQLCGPQPQWFLESTLDLCLPHAGVYCEIKDQKLPSAVELARCLYPECGILAKDRDNRPVREFRRWCDARRLSALVEDWQVGAASP